MKKTIKILRSTIASLLFLILIVTVIVQFTFTSIHKDHIRIPDRISREKILNEILKDNTLKDETKKIAIEYIDNYINYIFYKRSYPSIQTIDFENLPEEQINEAKNTISKINKEIELDYELIIKMREVNNTISNGSIYLMLNIAILVILLLIMIVTFEPIKTLIFFGIGIIIGTLLSLIGSIILASNIQTLVPQALHIILDSIISKRFLSSIHAQSLIYIIIGMIIFLCSYIYSKRHIFHKQNSIK